MGQTDTGLYKKIRIPGKETRVCREIPVHDPYRNRPAVIQEYHD